jgi:hypothetical protein
MLSSWENPLFRLGHGFKFANCECLLEIDCHRKNVRVYVRKNVRMSECMMPFILPDYMSETIDYGRMVCQGGDHWKYFFIETVHFFMVSQNVSIH